MLLRKNVPMHKRTLYLGLMLLFGPSLAVSADTIHAQGQTPASGDAGTATTLEEDLGRVFAKALVTTGSMTKSVGSALGRYVKNIHLESEKRALADQFYTSFDRWALSYQLGISDYEELRHRVEAVYIEEDLTRKNGLDLIYFREIPNVVKKEYADMLKRSTGYKRG